MTASKHLMNRPIFVGLVFIPVCFYVVAALCGWFGLFVGRTIDAVSLLLWLILALLFAYRLAVSRRMPLVLLNICLLCICVVGMWLSLHTRPFLSAFEARVKHEYADTHEMQSWASGILQTAKHEDYSLDESSYPTWAFKRGFPRPFIFIVNDENFGSNGYLQIGWGSGVMGTWGIAIGKSDLPKKGRQWTNGIYFFANPEPCGWRD